MPRPDFCPCDNEKPDPCPACGATVSGKDGVRGICQARRAGPPPLLPRLVVIDKHTGKIV